MSDHNSGTDWPKILIGELGRFGFGNLSLVARLLCGKIAKLEMYDQVRVNGVSNYEYPGQRWFPS